jgi:putative heme utilization carrier protein HutX
MSLSPEQRAALSERLAANPGLVLEELARTFACPLQSAIECLPPQMRERMDGQHFVAVMQEVARWATPVTVIMHTRDAIVEVTGPLPAGEVGHGFYNIAGTTGLHGHFQHRNCAAIWRIERPFMGKDTASLWFCNRDGEVMFKIFVGRDEGGALRAEQLAALRALPARLSAEASA